MKKPINTPKGTLSDKRTGKRTTVHYETIGDMLAARHLRAHGSYPMWHGRQLRHA